MSIIQAPRPAVKPRRRFAEGLGERCPVFASVVSLADMAWWEEHAAREEDAMFDRLAREAEAMDRMERCLDA